MAHGDPKAIPRGRLLRVGKLVSLGARVSSAIVQDGVRRVLGGESGSTAAAEKVIATLGEMKGAALKLGQALTMAHDRLPPEMQKLMGRLFAEAPPLPFEAAAEVIAAELGKDVGHLFAEFEPQPFAAASLGQVHRARLFDGTIVCVKVQYPGVENSVRDDLANAGLVARVLGAGQNLFDTQHYYNEVRRELLLELDYRRELSLLQRFATYLSPWSDLQVPSAFPTLSSARVLTMELLQGETLHAHTHNLPPNSRADACIGEQLQRAVYGPFLRHGVIHADTHPGNFLVMKDGRLGVLDFGSAKAFSEPFWLCYRGAMEAGLAGRHPDLLTLVKNGGFTVELPDDKARRLLDEIAHIVSKPLHGPYDFAHGTMMEDIRTLRATRLLELMRVRPPAEAILFFRALAGMAHNMRALRYSGDLRPHLQQILAMPVNYVGNAQI